MFYNPHISCTNLQKSKMTKEQVLKRMLKIIETKMYYNNKFYALALKITE